MSTAWVAAPHSWHLHLTDPSSPPPLHAIVQLAALSSLHALGYEAEHRGDALLGYVATRCVAGVLLATRTREKGVLPGGHALLTLTESAWLLLPLSQVEGWGSWLCACMCGCGGWGGWRGPGVVRSRGVLSVVQGACIQATCHRGFDPPHIHPFPSPPHTNS